MHVSAVYLLRQALQLDPPGTPVKVIDPYQMLGEIKLDLVEALGVDVVPLTGTSNVFGFKNENWKEWTLFDGTPVLVPEKFNTEPEPNGDILQYPQGDKSAPPSGRMPKGGYYFDIIVRQPPIDDDHLNVEDNLEEFAAVSEEELEHFRREAERLYGQTDKAIFANFGGTSFGNIARVPAPMLKYPKGIRDIEEWYVSLSTRQDYIHQLFHRQCEIALENLRKIHRVVGNQVSLIFTSGTDFGTQNGLFISRRIFRDLFLPYYRRINDWIHRCTTWKSFIHTDGTITPILDDIIECGFDVLNPIQWTAADMDPQYIKDRYGDRLVLWGGGIDTQKTLPFGTPEEVRAEVKRMITIFGARGGYVFNTIHNVQAKTPVQNLLAMFQAVREFGTY